MAEANKHWTEGWRGGGGGLIDISSGYQVMHPQKCFKTKFPSLLMRFIMIIAMSILKCFFIQNFLFFFFFFGGGGGVV